MRRATPSRSATRSAPQALRTEAAPSRTLAGKPLEGLLPVAFADGDGYGMVAPSPSSSTDKQVGAVALITPISDDYLDHLGKKVDADLALRVDGKLVAATIEQPQPRPRLARRRRQS